MATGEFVARFDCASLRPILTAISAFLAVTSAPEDVEFFASVPRLKIDGYLAATSVVEILRPIKAGLVFSYVMLAGENGKGLVLDEAKFSYGTTGSWVAKRILGLLAIEPLIHGQLQQPEHLLKTTLPYRLRQFGYRAPIGAVETWFEKDLLGVRIKSED